MYTHIAHKTVYKRLSCETLYFLTGCKVTIFLNYNRIDIHYKFGYQILNDLLCLKKAIKYFISLPCLLSFQNLDTLSINICTGGVFGSTESRPIYDKKGCPLH